MKQEDIYEIRYCVYEILPECRECAILLKKYKLKKSAIACMEKSIFRYILIEKHKVEIKECDIFGGQNG